MSETFTVGRLSFSLHRSPSRKTLGITIERDGRLTLSAPINSTPAQIERGVLQKQFWIYTKLAQKQLLFRSVASKEFVPGESFDYLGRRYRLALVPSDHTLPALRLHQGEFQLQRCACPEAYSHFVRWYMVHGQPWLQRRVELFAARLYVNPTSVAVRDLGYRWGSCSPNGSLNFHWRTVLLPPRIIEYIVVHELVHLHQPHHNPDFHRRLQRVLSDASERQQWLAENGIHFSLTDV